MPSPHVMLYVRGTLLALDIIEPLVRLYLNPQHYYGTSREVKKREYRMVRCHESTTDPGSLETTKQQIKAREHVVPVPYTCNSRSGTRRGQVDYKYQN
jgi:hypothetical protein